MWSGSDQWRSGTKSGMAESEMSTKTPRSGAGWKSGGTRGRADGSERAVLYLFLMFLLTRCRCLPISFLSHIFFSFFFMLQFVVPYCCRGAVERLEAVRDINNRPMGVRSVGCTRTSDLPGCRCRAGFCRRHQGLYWARVLSSRCRSCSAERELASPSPPIKAPSSMSLAVRAGVAPVPPSSIYDEGPATTTTAEPAT